MTYLATVLADAPTHYYRCADPLGSVLFDIGSAPLHCHTVVNSVTGVSGLSLGYSGPNTDTGALDCCLTGVYANTGSPAAFAAGRVSMECWIWQFQNITGVGTYLNALNGANAFGLFRNGTQWVADYNNTNAAFAVNYTYQAWHHLVMTYDLVNVSLYVDGTVRATAAVAASLAFSSVFAIGTNLGLSNWGQAFMSEVAVYNTTLTAARVTAHYVAADNVGVAPTFRQAGIAPVAGAGGVPISDLQASILASVRKTY